MTETKRVSINQMDEIMKERYLPTETIECAGIEITIKKTLSLKEMMSFVNNVVKCSFTEANNEYIPEIKDFLIKCNILERYSNISLPKNTEHRYDLVYCTEVVDQVTQYINRVQLKEIVNAIDEKIDGIVQANMEEINKRVNEVMNSFSELNKQFESIFSGVSGEEIAQFLGAANNGSIDEEKIVRAYIDQKNSEVEE